LADAVRITRELINNSQVPAIFEATFTCDGVLVRVDVLRRKNVHQFRVIEVKSTTSVKPYHLWDVSIQTYVLRGAGIQISSNHLLHVNPEYTFDGELNISKLFVADDISQDRLLSRSAISEILNEQYGILSRPEPPKIETGIQCERPYRCEFYEYCHTRPDFDDVRFLPIAPEKISMLLHNDVRSISDLPSSDELRLYWHFTNRECSTIDAAKRARVRGLSINLALKKELAALQYPLCFMDFETITPAVP